MASSRWCAEAVMPGGQVVLGVLGCPNLPVEPLTPEQGEAGAAEHAGEPGYGCMFAAQLHEGAFVGPLQGRRKLCLARPLKQRGSGESSIAESPVVCHLANRSERLTD